MKLINLQQNIRKRPLDVYILGCILSDTPVAIQGSYIERGWNQLRAFRNEKWILEWRVNSELTHWDRATHTCVGDLTITGSDNGLSPGRRQAII